MNLNGLVFKGRESYQRDDFDCFLKDMKFEYKVPSIHIAGTNGKGSTAHYLYSIYRAAGYHVALFTSPFLLVNNEMISIDGVNISDDEAESIINPVRDILVKHKLSAFEIETYIALKYFSLKQVDIAIIECGMGGEIDATNVFTPILSIITSVSLEHTDFLGRSLNEVALHKAGIIKKDIPVLIPALDEEAEMTIASVAKSKKSKIYKAREINSYTYHNNGIIFSYALFNNIYLPSSAYYEIKNASLAIESALILREKYPFSDKIIENCFENCEIPARMQVFDLGCKVIVDGAHNPEATATLIDSIIKLNIQTKIHIIFASFNDKNISMMLPKLSIISDDITLTTFDNSRARKYEDYFIYTGDYSYVDDYKKLIKDKMKEFKDDVILITGSLAFAGIVSNEFTNGEYKDVCAAS